MKDIDKKLKDVKLGEIKIDGEVMENLINKSKTELNANQLALNDLSNMSVYDIINSQYNVVN